MMKTFSDLVRFGYRLEAYCPVCKVSRAIDIARQNPQQSFAKANFCCKDCGSTGHSIILPGSMRREDIGPPDASLLTD